MLWGQIIMIIARFNVLKGCALVLNANQRNTLCKFYASRIPMQKCFKVLGLFTEQSFLQRSCTEMFMLICNNRFCAHSEQVLPSIHTNPDYPCELVGTWNTWYGEQDQAGAHTRVRYFPQHFLECFYSSRSVAVH